jgi:hypothetical protein
MRPGRNHTRTGIGDTTNLNRTLGNKVDVVFDTFVDLIEELMQRDEGSALSHSSAHVCNAIADQQPRRGMRCIAQ